MNVIYENSYLVLSITGLILLTIVWILYYLYKKVLRVKKALFHHIEITNNNVEKQSLALKDSFQKQAKELEQSSARLKKSIEKQSSTLKDSFQKQTSNLEQSSTELKQTLAEQSLGISKTLELSSKNYKEQTSKIQNKLEKLEKLEKIENALKSLQSNQRDQDIQLYRFSTSISAFSRQEGNSKASYNIDDDKYTIKQRISNEEPVTILIAGMRHSGSTAIFNLVRYLFNQYDISYQSGYSELQFFNRKSDVIRIIKTHEYRDDIYDAADFIITLTRDLRDTVASAARRKFEMIESLGGVVNYAKYNRGVHDSWSNKTNHNIIYETFKSQQADTVERLCINLGFKDADIDQLCKLINNIPTDNYEETLLTKEHITNIDGKLKYQDVLTEAESTSIWQQNFSWLKKNTYLKGND